MTQGVSEKFWQAEARTEETKLLIRDIKRITRRKFSAEEKIRYRGGQGVKFLKVAVTFLLEFIMMVTVLTFPEASPSQWSKR